MKLFINPHAGTNVNSDTWNISSEEPEQITVIRGGRAYVLAFQTPPVLEVWSLRGNEDFDTLLHSSVLPKIEEQLEFDFVKSL